MAYLVGDRIAHPLHGAGVIDSIETQRSGGVDKQYYVMRVSHGDILVKIPMESSDAIGVRPLMNSEQVKSLLEDMSCIEIEMTTNWNKRYRENMLKIRSGDLLEVAGVIKGLYMRESGKGLSTGERKMLNSARQILLSELVMVQSFSYDEAEAQVRKALS